MVNFWTLTTYNVGGCEELDISIHDCPEAARLALRGILDLYTESDNLTDDEVDQELWEQDIKFVINAHEIQESPTTKGNTP